MILRRDSRARPEPDTSAMPTRPPEDPWLFGAARAAGRGMEGDPCGGETVKASSDEDGDA